MAPVRQTDRLAHRDFLLGTLIAAVMAIAWILASSGRSLIATFLPGLLFAWMLFAARYGRATPFPDRAGLLRIYIPALAWQCVHFLEELSTGFNSRFPALYGGTA